MTEAKVDKPGIQAGAMRALRLVVLAAAMVATAGWAQETRRVAENGSDTGDCVATACQTIQYAIDQADVGDTVEVGPGTYVGSLYIGTDGLTLTSSSGPADTEIDAGDAENAVLIGSPFSNESSEFPTAVTVAGFTVTNWAQRGIAQRMGDGTVHILNNTLIRETTGARNAIGIAGGTGSTVIGNTIESTTFDNPNWSGSGIAMWGSVDALIEDNKISGSDHGINVIAAYTSDPNWVEASGNVLRNNTISDVINGVALQGNVNATMIDDNIIKGGNRGVLVERVGDFGYPADTAITGNTIRENLTGLQISDPGADDPGVWIVEGNHFISNQLNLLDPGNQIGLAQLEASNTISNLVRMVAIDGEDTGACIDSACLTIQYAVDQAGQGDVVEVASGNYPATGHILINKDISIVGGVGSKPILGPGNNMTGGNPGQAWILVEQGVEFRLENVVLDGDGYWIHYGLRSHGNTVVNAVDFRNIRGSLEGSPYQGLGIAGFGGHIAGGGGAGNYAASQLEVSNSSFEQIGRIGIVVKGDQATADITDNVYTGKGEGDFIDYFVDVGSEAVAVITGNSVSGNHGVASSDGSTSAAILVSSYWGEGPSHAHIEGNHFIDNHIGVGIGFDDEEESVVSIENNTFTDNRHQINLSYEDDDLLALAVINNTFEVDIELSVEPGLPAGLDAAAGWTGFTAHLSSYGDVPENVVLWLEAAGIDNSAHIDGASIEYFDGSAWQAMGWGGADHWNINRDGYFLGRDANQVVGFPISSGHDEQIPLRVNWSTGTYAIDVTLESVDSGNGSGQPGERVWLDWSGAFDVVTDIGLVPQSRLHEGSTSVSDSAFDAPADGQAELVLNFVLDSNGLITGAARDDLNNQSPGAGAQPGFGFGEVLAERPNDSVSHFVYEGFINSSPWNHSGAVVTSAGHTGARWYPYVAARADENGNQNADGDYWIPRADDYSFTLYWYAGDPGQGGTLVAVESLELSVIDNSAAADLAQVYVDDDFADENHGASVSFTLPDSSTIEGTVGLDAFATLAAGLGAVADGGTVYLASGNYVTDRLAIDNDLAVIGVGDKPKISPADDMIGDNAGDAWILVEEGIAFGLANVIIDGGASMVNHALRSHGDMSIDSVDFQNIENPSKNYAGMAVLSFGGHVAGGAGAGDYSAAHLEVTNSTFEQIGRIGILVKGSESTATIADNDFVGKGSGDHLDYGVDLGAEGAATITGNTFSGHRGVASTDGSTSAGIIVTSYWGTSESNAIINDNVFVDNSHGVAVGYGDNDANHVTIENNSFTNNRYPLTLSYDDFDLIEGALEDNDFDRVIVILDGDDSLAVTNIYSRIQDAIAAAEDGHSIVIAPGDYATSGQVLVDKSLSIRADDPAQRPVITPDADVTGTNADDAWWLVEEGVELSLTDLVFDGDEYFVHHGIRNHGDTTIDTVSFRNIQGSLSGRPYRGFAVLSYGGVVNGGSGADSHGAQGLDASTLTVTNSDFEQIGRVGVLVKGTEATANLTDLTYTGKGSGDFLDYAFEAGAGAQMSLSGSTVSGNLGVADTDGSTSAAVMATTFFGDGTSLDLQDNEFSGSSAAVMLGFNQDDSTSLVARNNQIVGNTVGMLALADSIQADATCNWWGDETGPGGDGTGLGDPVIGPVSYEPWNTLPEGQCAGTPADLALSIDGPMMSGPTSDIFHAVTLVNNGGSALPENVMIEFAIARSGIEDTHLALDYCTDIDATSGEDCGNWAALPVTLQNDALVGVFGPAGGFPVAADHDATSFFRSNFSEPGHYGLAIEAVGASSDSLFASATTELAIAALEFDIEPGVDAGVPSDEEGWAYYSTTLVNLGDALPENVLLWVDVDGIDQAAFDAGSSMQWFNADSGQWTDFAWGDHPGLDSSAQREAFFLGRDGAGGVVGFPVGDGEVFDTPVRVNFDNASYDLTVSVESADSDPVWVYGLFDHQILVESDPVELSLAIVEGLPAGVDEADGFAHYTASIENAGGAVPEHVILWIGVAGIDDAVKTGSSPELEIEYFNGSDWQAMGWAGLSSWYWGHGRDAWFFGRPDTNPDGQGPHPIEGFAIGADHEETLLLRVNWPTGSYAIDVTIESADSGDNAGQPGERIWLDWSQTLAVVTDIALVPQPRLHEGSTSVSDSAFGAPADGQAELVLNFVLDSNGLITGAARDDLNNQSPGAGAQPGFGFGEVLAERPNDSVSHFVYEGFINSSPWNHSGAVVTSAGHTGARWYPYVAARADENGNQNADGDYWIPRTDDYSFTLYWYAGDPEQGGLLVAVESLQLSVIDESQFQDELIVTLADIAGEYARGAVNNGNERVLFDYTNNAGDIEQLFNVFTVHQDGVEIDPATYAAIFQSVNFPAGQIRGLTGTDPSVVTAPADLVDNPIEFTLTEDAPLGDYEIIVTSFDVTGIDPNDVALGDIDSYRVLHSASQSVSLIHAPVLSITPASHDFGQVGEFDTASTAFTLSNDGSFTTELTLGTIEIVGGDAGAYQIAGDCSENGVLAGGSSCEVEVTFVPGAPGSFADAQLLVASDVNAVSADLTGTGIQPDWSDSFDGAFDEPDWQFFAFDGSPLLYEPATVEIVGDYLQINDPAALYAGGYIPRSFGESRVATLTNADGTNTGVSPDNQIDHGVLSHFDPDLTHGYSAYLRYELNYQDLVVIKFDADNFSPAIIDERLRLAESSDDDWSIDRMYVVELDVVDQGGEALIVARAFDAGTGALLGTVEASDSDPLAAGYAGVVAITNSIGLNGTFDTAAAVSSFASADLSDVLIDFGAVDAFDNSAPQTVTIDNRGNAELLISELSIGGNNAGAFSLADGSCDSSVAAGDSCSFEVVFTPEGVGSASAEIVIESNASTSPDVVLLEGEGTVIAATISLSNLEQTYDGDPKPVTVTTDPAGLNVVVTYDGQATVPTDAGSYAVDASIDDPGYSGSASDTLVIAAAPVALTFDNLVQVYDGSEKLVTVMTVPADLDVVVTYDGASTGPVDAGSYLVYAEVVDPNYQPVSDSAVLVVEPGQADVVLTDLVQTWDNDNPLPVTVTTDPTGLNVIVTYDGMLDAPTGVGSYVVFATIDDVNWNGSASGMLVVEPVSASITLDGLNQVYDGTPRVVTAMTDPAGLAVDISYDGLSAAPTDVGSYQIVATIVDANHTGSVSDTLVVSRAQVDAIVITELEQTYNGQPREVVVTTTPAGLDVVVTYDGSTAAPVDVGSYPVEVTVSDVNYFGSASDTLVVNQGSQTIDFPALADRSVDDSPFAISASADSGLTVAFSVLSGPASVDGDMVTLTGELGEVVIEAAQAGDDNWLPADPVQQSFAVSEGDGHSMEAVSATTISGESGEPVDAADRPTVRVLDEHENPVAGVSVSFEVTAGSGTVSGSAQLTDEQGLAQVGGWLLGNESTQTLIATAPGLEGSPVEFTAEVDAVIGLEISITDNRDTIEPGERNTYVVVASNAGPNTAVDATVSVGLPQHLVEASADWTCYAGLGASCGTSGTGGIDDSVTLPAGSSVVYVLEADVDPRAHGNIEVQAILELDEEQATDSTTTTVINASDSIFRDRFEPADSEKLAVEAAHIQGHLLIDSGFRGGVPPRVLLGGQDRHGNDVFRVRSFEHDELSLVRIELRDGSGQWQHGNWLEMQPASQAVLAFEFDSAVGLLMLVGESADSLIQSNSRAASSASSLYTDSNDQVEIVLE